MSMLSDLQNFFDGAGIDARVVSEERHGPFCQFRLELGARTQINKIESRAREIGLAVSCNPPFISTDGKHLCLDFMDGIHPDVSFDKLSEDFKASQFHLYRNKLPVLLGTVNVDTSLVLDLAQMPHLLVTGTTGSGKSICVHAIIHSLVMQSRHNDVKLILVDPKQVEFSRYENLDCLKKDNVYTPEAALEMMESLCELMDTRLEFFRRHECRDIGEYRAKGGKVDYVVVIIDELSDLIRKSKKDFKLYLERLAAKGRAAGINMVGCSQYPHSDILASTISANFDGRISFRLQTATQSRVVLGREGAERLSQKGDGLLMANGFQMQRFHSALVTQNPEWMEPFMKRRVPSSVKKFFKLFA